MTVQKLSSIGGFLVILLAFDVTVSQEGEYYVEEEVGPDWWREGNFEYHFASEFLNYAAASAWCTDHHADIVYINGSTENNFIHSKRPQDKEAWIGLERVSIQIEGKWYWAWDKREFNKEYYNWAKGEPRNSNDRFCTVYRENSASWKSADCDIPKYFICKRTVDACTPSPCKDHEECVLKGDNDFECVCHHCPPPLEAAFAKVTSSKLLLALFIIAIIIVLGIILVVCCTCVRGCLEKKKTKKKRKQQRSISPKANRSGRYNVQRAEAEMHFSEEPERKLLGSNDAPTILSELPPKKSAHQKTNSSLSDSARGRSSHSESEDSDDDTTDVKSHTMTSQCEVHAPPDDRYDIDPRIRDRDVESAL